MPTTRRDITPTNVEGAFGIDELFFSTTDRKGVIRSGNDVFVRLSKHPLGDLLGTPHNIIRHPDMPRAVFWLLWDYLRAGKMIAAYVKNMAADGSYYWVLAMVTPLPDGYLSVRMKPTTETFGAVKDVYHSLRNLEREREAAGEPPKRAMMAAVEHLGAVLGSLGFASYDDFMCHALLEEMRARDAALATDTPAPSAGVTRSGDPSRDRFASVRASIERVYERVDEIAALQEGLVTSVDFARGLSRRFHLAAMNTAIRSARIGADAEGLGTIASNLGESATAVQERAESFSEQAARTSAGLRRCIFHLAMIRAGAEMAGRFCDGAGEDDDRSGDPPNSRQALPDVLEDLRASMHGLLGHVLGSVRELAPDLTAMAQDADGLCRTVLMLRFAQFAGVVESARLNASATLGPLLAEIGDSIEKAQQEFTALGFDIERLGNRVDAMPRVLRGVREQLAPGAVSRAA